jgi:tetratricopeptide (TPR) repeat protein
MESLLPVLENAVSQDEFVRSVGLAVGRGSGVAARYVHDNWADLAATLPADDLYHCIASYVSYCNQTDTEEENLDFVLASLDQVGKAADDPAIRAGVFNQKQRMYYGIYENSHGERAEYLDKAIEAAETAIALNPAEASFLYNYAMLLRRADRLQEAVEAIDRCLAVDEESAKDDDHLNLAHRIYRQANDPRANDILAALREVNPYLADLARRSVVRGN